MLCAYDGSPSVAGLAIAAAAEPAGSFAAFDFCSGAPTSALVRPGGNLIRVTSIDLAGFSSSASAALADIFLRSV